MARRRGRARGDIRQAMADAAWQLASERACAPVPGASWREIAQRATCGQATGVAWAKAKSVARDMLRAGELCPVGQLQMPHARRPMLALAPASRGQGAQAPGADLMMAMQGWRVR